MHHELVIEEFGGSPGLRNEDALDAIVDGARTNFGYEEDLMEVAAGYLLYINQRHPFVDGNKRVSTSAAIRFLSWNGVATGHSTKQLEQLVLSIADCTSQQSRGSTARQLRQIFL